MENKPYSPVSRKAASTGKTLGNIRAAAGKSASAAEAAEAAYRQMLKSGKVGPSNVNAVKKKISDKYGVWPNGNTN